MPIKGNSWYADSVQKREGILGRPQKFPNNGYTTRMRKGRCDFRETCFGLARETPENSFCGLEQGLRAGHLGVRDRLVSHLPPDPDSLKETPGLKPAQFLARARETDADGGGQVRDRPPGIVHHQPK